LPCFGLRAVFKPRRGHSVPHAFGGHSEGETPLPIPNRAVKPLCADGTWWATAWESRSPPALVARPAPVAGLFLSLDPPGSAEWQEGARQAGRRRREWRRSQAPRRAEANASHPVARREDAARPGRSRGPSAVIGSRPYSPSVAKSIARSAALSKRWPSAFRLSNMRASLRTGADVRSLVQRNLHRLSEPACRSCAPRGRRPPAREPARVPAVRASRARRPLEPPRFAAPSRARSAARSA
jgi:hypothetical protein